MNSRWFRKTVPYPLSIVERIRFSSLSHSPHFLRPCYFFSPSSFQNCLSLLHEHLKIRLFPSFSLLYPISFVSHAWNWECVFALCLLLLWLCLCCFSVVVSAAIGCMGVSVFFSPGLSFFLLIRFCFCFALLCLCLASTHPVSSITLVKSSQVSHDTWVNAMKMKWYKLAYLA